MTGEKLHLTKIHADGNYEERKSKKEKRETNRQLLKLIAKIAAFILLFIVLFAIAYTPNDEQDNAITVNWDEQGLNYSPREKTTKDSVYQVKVTYFKNNLMVQDGYSLFRVKYTVKNISDKKRVYTHSYNKPYLFTANDYSYDDNTNSSGSVEASIKPEDKKESTDSPNLPNVKCDWSQKRESWQKTWPPDYYEIDLEPGESREIISCGWHNEKSFDFKLNIYKPSRASIEFDDGEPDLILSIDL